MPRRRSKKLQLVLIGSALFTSGARLSYNYLRFREIKSHFRTVSLGMSRKDVDRLLGDPNHHKGQCGYLKNSSRGCVLEYVYSHPLGPLHPEYYVVEFSSADRVISAVHLNDE